MSGREKNTGHLTLVLASAKSVLAISVIGFVMFMIFLGAREELVVERDSALSRVPLGKNDIVLEAITDIENSRLDSAMEKCRAVQDEDVPDDVKKYMNDFWRYYQNYQNYQKKSKSENVSGQIQDESYFVGAAAYISRYLSENTDLSPTLVLHAAEVIPHYCISRSPKLHKTKASINQEIYSLCGQYIQQFVYPQDSPTRMSADIICLEIKSRARSRSTRDKDHLRQVVSLIDEYQKRYEETLGENGTFYSQRDYLESVRGWCMKKINGKHFIGGLPDYYM